MNGHEDKRLLGEDENLISDVSGCVVRFADAIKWYFGELEDRTPERVVEFQPDIIRENSVTRVAEAERQDNYGNIIIKDAEHGRVVLTFEEREDGISMAITVRKEGN